MPLVWLWGRMKTADGTWSGLATLFLGRFFEGAQNGPDLTCEYHAGCGKPADHGLSLGGERYRRACWEHALFHAIPLARTVTTVELAPLDWA